MPAEVSIDVELGHIDPSQYYMREEEFVLAIAEAMTTGMLMRIGVVAPKDEKGEFVEEAGFGIVATLAPVGAVPLPYVNPEDDHFHLIAIAKTREVAGQIMTELRATLDRIATLALEMQDIPPRDQMS